VGLQRLQGTCRGTAGGLQGDCRDTAGRLQGDSRGTAGQLQGDCKNWEGIPKKRHDQTSEDIRRGLQGDCLLHVRLHWGLQGDSAGGTARGLQENSKGTARRCSCKPWRQGCRGNTWPSISGLGPACEDFLQGELGGDSRGTARSSAGGLQDNPEGTARRCSWKPWRQGYPRNMWPSLRTGVQGGQGGLQRTPGTAGGLQGGLQGDCRGPAGKLQGDCKEMFLETPEARVPQEHLARLRSTPTALPEDIRKTET
jgi:hypothetical protein